MKKANLILIGFRGCGKTTFGREMAKILDLPFADLDEQVAFLLDRPLEEFVAERGWQVFREIEQRVAHDFTRNFSGIIATGGGTIENSKNLQNLKKTGNFLFLNPSFLQVKKYLMADETRPRLSPDIPLSQEIDQMWAQRKDIYSASADAECKPDLNGEVEAQTREIIANLPADFIPSQPKKKRVVVFSSSNGTTFQGILDAQKEGRIPNVECLKLVSDQPNCGAVAKAKKAGIEVQIIEPTADQSSEEYDQHLIDLLRECNPDVVLLAGWMRILSAKYCELFGSISWNAHPSLLPNYAGMKDTQIHEAVIENEDKYTGCTIHKLVEKVDTGEVVTQRKVLVDEHDSAESLKMRVQKQEILGFCEALELK